MPFLGDGFEVVRQILAALLADAAEPVVFLAVVSHDLAELALLGFFEGRAMLLDACVSFVHACAQAVFCQVSAVHPTRVS